MRVRFRSEEGVRDMGLKAPASLHLCFPSFLTVIVLMSEYFGAEIPGLKGNELWALLGVLRSPDARMHGSGLIVPAR